MIRFALMIALLLWPGASACAHPTGATVVADTSVAHPAYPPERGPLVAVDAGHNNYHTIGGLYAPFAAVLRNDGYRLASPQGPLSEPALRDVAVLVIVNSQARENVESWKLPTPSAFKPAEIEALKTWVGGGGSLFLIADHMPFPGAVTPLAAAFGFEFDNGFAVLGDGKAPELFTLEGGAVGRHQIMRGSPSSPPITKVRTFTGSSFRAPAEAIPLLRLGPGWSIWTPVEAWKFVDGTPERPATTQDLRGAALEFGRGRIVVFSEAAMFTAQPPQGDRPAPGFQAAEAEQNKPLLLNVMHWLSRAPAR